MGFKPQKQTPKGSGSIYKDPRRIKFWSWCRRHGVPTSKVVAHEERHGRKTSKARINKVLADVMDTKVSIYKDQRRIKFWSWCRHHGVSTDKIIAHEAKHGRKVSKASINQTLAKIMKADPQKRPAETSLYKNPCRIKFWSWCRRHNVSSARMVAHEKKYGRKVTQTSINKTLTELGVEGPRTDMKRKKGTTSRSASHMTSLRKYSVEQITQWHELHTKHNWSYAKIGREFNVPKPTVGDSIRNFTARNVYESKQHEREKAFLQDYYNPNLKVRASIGKHKFGIRNVAKIVKRYGGSSKRSVNVMTSTEFQSIVNALEHRPMLSLAKAVRAKGKNPQAFYEKARELNVDIIGIQRQRRAKFIKKVIGHYKTRAYSTHETTARAFNIHPNTVTRVFKPLNVTKYRKSGFKNVLPIYSRDALYLVELRFQNGQHLLKVGRTTSIQKRYSKDPDVVPYKVLGVWYSMYRDVDKIEAAILKKYRRGRVLGPSGFHGRTECFGLNRAVGREIIVYAKAAFRKLKAKRRKSGVFNRKILRIYGTPKRKTVNTREQKRKKKKKACTSTRLTGLKSRLVACFESYCRLCCRGP